MEQNHIIHKVVIEVSVNNREKAYEIKNDISSFLTLDIFPKLEQHLSIAQAALPAHTLQISRLSIRLDESQSSLNSTLQNSIMAYFKEELAATLQPVLSGAYDAKNDSEITLLGEEESLLRTFIHFLENGYMPWWNSNEKATTILDPAAFEKIMAATAFATTVANSIRKSEVRERMINQLTDTQLKKICFTVLKSKGLTIAVANTALQQLLGKSFIDRKVVWALILNVLNAALSGSDAILEDYIVQETIRTVNNLKRIDHKNTEQIWNGIMTLFPFVQQKEDCTAISTKIAKIGKGAFEKANGKNLKGDKNERQTGSQPLNADSNTETKITAEINGYHVQNAGLVLIHPFINNLFKHCNLIDPKTKKLIDPEIGIHLLHYIATGKTNQPESSMLFEKFLCNIPMHQSISRHVKLSRRHKSEAAKVIAAVQQNWSSMKTASVALLQNEFFQRSGKLVLHNNQTLTIERKTQDILLEKISWGIGFIKLPWQNQFIYVNW